MKKAKINRILNIAIGVAVAAVAVYWLWGALGVGEWVTIKAAVADIENGRRQADARQDLRNAGNRKRVIEALKDALADADGPVSAKINLLSTLSAFKENRVVRRAIDSPVLNTRRAAVWMRADDPAIRDRAREIALGWLKDEEADARQWAILLCSKSRLDIEEAVPVLESILGMRARTQSEQELVRHAIGTLSGFKPAGLAPKLVAMARDTSYSDLLRGEALAALGRLDDAPVDDVRAMALEIVQDKSASNILRGKVTSVLRLKKYADEQVWDVLEKVVIDENDDDWITQRTCLSTLGSTVPLDRLENLLLDKRVWRHKYFAVRIDVAAALAALNVRKRIALEILCEYLIDSDSDDRQHQVPQEGYLSWFALTGIAPGVEDKELFRHQPRPIPDRERARDYLWRNSIARPGFAPRMVDAVKKIAGDREKMKQVYQTCKNLIPDVVKRWEDEEKAKREKDAEKAPEEPDGGKDDRTGGAGGD